jgi:hypothetical protein
MNPKNVLDYFECLGVNSLCAGRTSEIAMIRSPFSEGAWKNLRLHKYARSIANWIVARSTDRARRRLSAMGRIKILVDNTTLGHAITHETAWIQGRKGMSAGPTESGYLARIPVHSKASDPIIYRNVRYLAGIAHLGRQGFIELRTSAELLDEQFRQPSGRFVGYGLFDLNLFAGVEIRSIDGYSFSRPDPYFPRKSPPVEQQRTRLKAREADPTYAALLKHLGNKNSQDTWHLLTAERHEMFCFLTMDFAFSNNVKAQIKSSPLAAFKTLVLTPEEFGKLFLLRPVSPKLLSFGGDSAPIRIDHSMPLGKRRSLKDYRR